ncbi:MAG: MarR family transcriptional regulator [Actinobacteria bacterium]|nr:MarR family transcriptional regulator [Actinomycetota bacterium]
MLSSVSSVDLAHRLRLVVGRLARRLRQRTLGELTPSQLSVLASLSRQGPMTLSALAETEGVAAASISGIVGRLVDKGLVERVPNPEDKRSTLVDMSSRGRQVLEKGRGERTAFLASRLDRLSAEEREVLAEAVAILARMEEE